MNAPQPFENTPENTLHATTLHRHLRAISAVTATLCALLGLSLLLLPGCPKAPADAPGADATTPAGGSVETVAVAAPAPPLDGWEQPAVAIVLSGEQHGYVEPCGCSETQSGGLARRHDLFKQLRARGWTVAGYDLGGALKRTREQSELKWQFTRNALDEMGYAAAAIGKEELALGADRLFLTHTNAEAGEGYRDGFDLPMLSANVVVYGDRSVGMPETHRIDKYAGTDSADGDTLTVGVTAIVGEEYAAALQGDPTLLRVEPAAESLQPVLAAFDEAQCDVRILLSHAKPSESRALAERFPQFDLIVTADGPEDPGPEPEAIAREGRSDALLLRVSQKGKYVGVVGVYPTGSGEPELRYELVNLDKDRFATSPEMVEWMRVYQDELKERDLAAARDAIPHPRGTGYVGAKACGACHTKAYAIWSKSRHAQAFDSLAHGREGTKDWWVDRSFDAECLACHVTGWAPQEIERFEGGFVSADQTPHLVGNGCENCHGPGEAHTQLETDLLAGGDFTEAHREQRQAVKLSKATAAADVCSKCHDLDNSPQFNFDLYWPKVEHVGRD